MLITSVALAKEGWHLVKFAIPTDDECELEERRGPFPIVLRDGLHDIAIVKHAININTDHYILVGDYQFADNLFMFLSEKITDHFQIAIAFKSGYDDPVATAVWFETEANRDAFETRILEIPTG